MTAEKVAILLFFFFLSRNLYFCEVSLQQQLVDENYSLLCTCTGYEIVAPNPIHLF